MNYFFILFRKCGNYSHKYSVEDDCYSIGAVAYTLLSRKRPTKQLHNMQLTQDDFPLIHHLPVKKRALAVYFVRESTLENLRITIDGYI